MIFELPREGSESFEVSGEAGFERGSGFGVESGMRRQDRLGERWILESVDGKWEMHAGFGLLRSERDVCTDRGPSASGQMPGAYIADVGRRLCQAASDPVLVALIRKDSSAGRKKAEAWS